MGLNYSPATITASGGTPPYAWSITNGSLPSGLLMSGGGVLSGTPTATGKPGFTVTVTDSVGATASSDHSIQVFSSLTTSALCSNQCGVEETCTICGAFGSVSGGESPYKYTTVQGAPPTGMGVNGLNLTGAFPPPGPIGSFVLSVVVTDQLGAQSRVDANWFVWAKITLTQTSFVCGNSPNSCSLQIPYSGGMPNGTPNYSLSVKPGAIIDIIGTNGCAALATTTFPPGMNGSGGGGIFTLNIGPLNSPYCGYSGTLLIQLVDQTKCGGPITNCLSNVATITVSI